MGGAEPSSRPAGEYREFQLGSRSEYSELPTTVEVGGRRYFLDRNEDGEFQLLADVCPHMGGTVENAGDCYSCPVHGWSFEHGSGECITTVGEHLDKYPVSVVDDYLIAQLPIPTAAMQLEQKETGSYPADLRIQLVGHACLKIVSNGFFVLTDPWLDGPAFMGSWIQYPPSGISADALEPDAIWISHEHPDHFHVQTLKRFNFDIPVYVPDFPNRRMVDDLEALGFTSVYPMRFGECVQLNEEISITIFEPNTLWNDAIGLFEFRGFRLLNLNDAGLNHRVAEKVAPVDVISSSFSPGASGYPMTWNHLTNREKWEISEKARVGHLQLLKRAVRLYRARYVLPFASYFRLWHPSHWQYEELLARNTPTDVLKIFENEDAQVIDILPGESWYPGSGKFDRQWKSRENLFDKDEIKRYLEEKWNATKFNQYHPAPAAVEESHVVAYLGSLNQVPEICHAEDLIGKLEITDIPDEDSLTVYFEIHAGEIHAPVSPKHDPDVVMRVPSGVFSTIVEEERSWDDAHIGYWCKFSRDPDIYHAGFWRLLQAPYFEKPADIPDNSPLGYITRDTVIAELLERYGDAADRILRRYGLYCLGCSHAPAESLGQGAEAHGIPKSRVVDLLQELNSALRGSTGVVPTE